MLCLRAACGDGDIGAHADRHLRRVASDDPAAEHHDFGGGHALDTTEQDAAAPLRALQEMGGNLRRHAAGNLDIGASRGNFPAASVTVS